MVHVCAKIRQATCLAVFGRIWVAVDGRKVVWSLGLARTVDAGDVEELFSRAFHGVRRTGVAWAATAMVCTEGSACTYKRARLSLAWPATSRSFSTYNSFLPVDVISVDLQTTRN